MRQSRRDALLMMLAASGALAGGGLVTAASAGAAPRSGFTTTPWAAGIEGQRKADLGDGRAFIVSAGDDTARQALERWSLLSPADRLA